MARERVGPDAGGSGEDSRSRSCEKRPGDVGAPGVFPLVIFFATVPGKGLIWKRGDAGGDLAMAVDATLNDDDEAVLLTAVTSVVE